MANILLVEDDTSSAAFVTEWLNAQQHELQVVNDGGEALKKMMDSEFDVILLDWNLPNTSGLNILREYRKNGKNTPVIMLTGRSDLKEKEIGLDSGADDYLTKPFHPKELLMRVKALLRRPSNFQSDVLSIGAIELHPTEHTVSNRGEPVRLSPIEFALLEFMLRHKGRTFSQEELLAKVWPSDSERTPDSIRTCIRKLRAKIDNPGDESLIENLHGLGYRLRS